jgi:hypothetical protein
VGEQGFKPPFFSLFSFLPFSSLTLTPFGWGSFPFPFKAIDPFFYFFSFFFPFSSLTLTPFGWGLFPFPFKAIDPFLLLFFFFFFYCTTVVPWVHGREKMRRNNPNPKASGRSGRACSHIRDHLKKTLFFFFFFSLSLPFGWGSFFRSGPRVRSF